MMTDAFTAARPEFRRAQTMAAKPLPLTAGEVAEYPRRRVSLIVTAVQFVACALPVFVLWTWLS